MAEITKEQLLEFIKNKDLDLDESYPRSDWWKFRNERDSLRKQRDELINDMAETKRKAEAFDEILETAEEDCWGEDFAVYISQVIDKYKEVDHEG
ncbi:hypothetical protein [Staphylococcus epidermidis]|uniref:hypothetical protein n=1 Tax=Staphylococcus epidermidis TaxID=1282 RepID=UPI000B00877B|nr:hypothetical protein [Staphylococcus epidermidis]